jgi:TPP-dependent pyruvate/acetoin dehydrogenase alpha subunit
MKNIELIEIGAASAHLDIDPRRIAHTKNWAAARQSGRSEELLRHYTRMRAIRQFEIRCSELGGGSEPLVAGSVHTCLGQEAIPVGALSCLRADDYVVSTYRGHGWILECGVPMEAVMAEVCHRTTGINGGRAGSPYFVSLVSQAGVRVEFLQKPSNQMVAFSWIPFDKT